MSRDDIEGVISLQRECFPEPFPEELLWTREHLEEHLDRFPDGQFVATWDNQVIGSASSARISERIWDLHLSWAETLGGLGLDGHDSDGTTLYGADISVHPRARGKGVGRALYQARFELVQQLGLVRYGTACRIPDAARWVKVNDSNVLRYAEAVADGAAVDRTMTPLLRIGLQYVQLIQNYMEDAESLDCAALLQWTPAA